MFNMRFKKKGMSLALEMVIVVAMVIALFFVWKFGILDRLIGMFGSIGYQIDTTQLDICQGIGTKKTGVGLSGFDSLTDSDEDQLPDYVCDTCICRDGYGVTYDASDTKCAAFGISATKESIAQDVMQGFLGILNDENIPNSIRCRHGGINVKPSENEFCSSNNLEIGISDTDNDFLPDVCDIDPDKWNTGKTLKCYNGPITVDGKVIGVVIPQELENALMKGTYQCVFAVCSPMNNFRYGSDPMYKKHCPQMYCSGGGPTQGNIFESFPLQGNSNNGCYCIGKNAFAERYAKCESSSCTANDEPSCP